MFESLLEGELPDDVTLAEARAFMLRPGGPLAELFKRPLRLRFCWAEEPPRDMPDSVTIGAFRAHANAGRARAILDDGEGGVPVPAH